MKRTLLLIVALFLSSASWAQRFEWAKGYGTAFPENFSCHITGSVTDSLGNLYILGQFFIDSEWEGESLLPMPLASHYNTIIAKISPSGEMLWKKVLFSNNNAGHLPNDIKKVGDSAFTCMVQMTLPTSDHYTYYLDTLIPGMSDYPITAMYVEWPLRTALITFDFEGNVLEQHFLYVTYTDTAGNDYVKYYNNDPTPWYSSYHLQNSSFDIDNDGNIYISYVAVNWIDSAINSQNGTIKGVKFWVDSTNVGHFTFENRPPMWYPQIVKFSPHFDTMLACRFVVQKSNREYVVSGTQTRVDKYGNVYFIPHIYQSGEYLRDSIIIDSLQNIHLVYKDKTPSKHFLVQFDSNLTPNWLITLDDSIISSGPCSWLLFHGIDFDYDSNLLFLTATTNRSTYLDTINFYSILTYHGMPLNLKKDGFFMSFKINDTSPVLHSYGRVSAVLHSSCATSADASPAMNSLICGNNRVIFQCKYYGGIYYPDSTIYFRSISTENIGLNWFDYRGNFIDGLHYSSYSHNSYPGPIVLHDSILYLMGRLGTDATFGDIQFPTNGRQYAYIAKYVDTAFMSPYIRPTNSLTPDISGDQPAVYPNPAHNKITVYPLSEFITDAIAISVYGIRTQLAASGNTVDISTLPPGIYILKITTPTNKYHHKFIKL